MTAQPQDVLALSDEEQAIDLVSESRPSRTCEAVSTRQPAKRKSQMLVANTAPTPKMLKSKVQGSCGCKCRCFTLFRDDAAFSELMKMRRTLSQLEKPEQDNFAHVSELK